MDIVELSRLQFAVTALYHFLFVPLTLGLSILLGIMETVYVMTGREIWRDMTKFWGALFGINFAMGVATGITMEFQFGTNWAYYSHYVGDVFGAPLAIEGLMAFFLEATFVGLFFFAWNRLSKISHLVVTWALAIATNLSALWILIANGWMQFPAGARFNADTMRMEVSNFMEVLFNPVAQAKFVHTVSAGYVVGAVFVLAISAYYLLRGRHVELAKRSMTVAASFGLASALSVVVLGDESGYTAGLNQKMKIAAVEAMWNTEPAPASFTVFGIPDLKTHTTKYEVKVPWMLGLIATRTADKEVPGINDLVELAKIRIKNGMIAYDALEQDQGRPRQPGTAQSPRQPCRRSRLCTAAQALPLRCAARHPGTNRRRCGFDDPRCAGAVLVLPVHGGIGLLLYSAVCRRILAGGQAQARCLAHIPACGAVDSTAALDRRGTRLDRRRIWPSALGDRRGLAHRVGRFFDGAGQCAVQPARFCAVLQHAFGR